MTERRLDRLRTIKSRMVRLNTRVETVRRLLPTCYPHNEPRRPMGRCSAEMLPARTAPVRGV